VSRTKSQHSLLTLHDLTELSALAADSVCWLKAFSFIFLAVIQRSSDDASSVRWSLSSFFMLRLPHSSFALISIHIIARP
jgi:hypothetical protein